MTFRRERPPISQGTSPATPATDQEEASRAVSSSSLRKIFIGCLITAILFTYMDLGNLQLLINSRYFADLGISDLWAGDEGRYYLHMAGINLVMLGVTVFLWVWRRMTGKRLLVLILFFNLAGLAAGYSSLHGKAFAVTNERMKVAAQELARAARVFPTANLNRYPRSIDELGRRNPPRSSYSYKGQRRSLKIAVIRDAEGPLKESGDTEAEAGTIFYAVDTEGKHFWVTYLEYDFTKRVSVFAAREDGKQVLVLTEAE